MIFKKNMVCAHGKMVVENTFQETGLNVVNVALGSVQIADQDVATERLEALEQQLESLGFIY